MLSRFAYCWVRLTETIRRIVNRSVFCEGVEIIGSAPFIDETLKALQILKQTSHWSLISGYLRVIKESQRTGAYVYGRRPIVNVGRRTWQYSTIWHAAGIAHETFHIILYRSASQRRFGRNKEKVWLGAQAERRCLAFELDVLRELGASDYLQQYVRDHMENPQYQGDPFSYADYLQRDW